jgi:hypothetical protein
MRQRQVIIKADDYARGMCSLDPWRRFIDVTVDGGGVPTVGVVAQALQTPRSASASYLRAIREEYGVEVWNHSFLHRDLTSLDEDAIVAELTRSQDLIELELGVRPRVFGAPFNRVDERSAGVVLASGEFDYYYCFDGLVGPEKNITKKSLAPIEQGTNDYRPLRFSMFESVMSARDWPEFVVFQVHPYYWTDECLASYRRMLRALVDKNYQFVSTEERGRYQCLRQTLSLPTPGLSLADNILWEEVSLTAFEEERQAGTTAGDSAYYFRALRVGTSGLNLFLRKLGFGGLPQVGDRREIIDIGAGVGNWSAAATLIDGVSALALDREDRHLKHLRLSAPGSRVRLEIASLDECSQIDGAFSGALCVNALNYMELLPCFKSVVRLLTPMGLFYVGAQNRLYPLRDAIASARAGDWDRAVAFLKRLVDNEGARCGLVTKTFVRYWSPNELSAAGIAMGLKLQRMGISHPGMPGELFGRPIFSGYLFLRSRAAEKMGFDIRAGKLEQPLFHEIAGSSSEPEFGSGGATSLGRLIGDVRRSRSTKPAAGREPESSASELALAVVAAVDVGDTAQIDALAHHFERLVGPFRFYAAACAHLRGVSSVGAQSNAAYTQLLELVRAVAARDSASLDQAVRELESVFRELDETALADWL